MSARRNNRDLRVSSPAVGDRNEHFVSQKQQERLTVLLWDLDSLLPAETVRFGFHRRDTKRFYHTVKYLVERFYHDTCWSRGSAGLDGRAWFYRGYALYRQGSYASGQRGMVLGQAAAMRCELVPVESNGDATVSPQDQCAAELCGPHSRHRDRAMALAMKAVVDKLINEAEKESSPMFIQLVTAFPLRYAKFIRYCERIGVVVSCVHCYAEEKQQPPGVATALSVLRTLCSGWLVPIRAVDCLSKTGHEIFDRGMQVTTGQTPLPCVPEREGRRIAPTHLPAVSKGKSPKVTLVEPAPISKKAMMKKKDNSVSVDQHTNNTSIPHATAVETDGLLAVGDADTNVIIEERSASQRNSAEPNKDTKKQGKHNEEKKMPKSATRSAPPPPSFASDRERFEYCLGADSADGELWLAATEWLSLHPEEAPLKFKNSPELEEEEHKQNLATVCSCALRTVQLNPGEQKGWLLLSKYLSSDETVTINEVTLTKKECLEKALGWPSHKVKKKNQRPSDETTLVAECWFCLGLAVKATETSAKAGKQVLDAPNCIKVAIQLAGSKKATIPSSLLSVFWCGLAESLPQGKPVRFLGRSYDSEECFGKAISVDARCVARYDAYATSLGWPPKKSEGSQQQDEKDDPLEDPQVIVPVQEEVEWTGGLAGRFIIGGHGTLTEGTYCWGCKHCPAPTVPPECSAVPSDGDDDGAHQGIHDPLDCAQRKSFTEGLNLLRAGGDMEALGWRSLALGLYGACGRRLAEAVGTPHLTARFCAHQTLRFAQNDAFLRRLAARYRERAIDYAVIGTEFSASRYFSNDSAKECFETALNLNSKSAVCWEHAAFWLRKRPNSFTDITLRSGVRHDQLRCWARAAELLPSKSAYWLGLGDCLAAGGSGSAAEFTPSGPTTHVTCTLQGRQHRFSKLDCYRKAVAVDAEVFGEPQLDSLFALGLLLLHLEDSHSKVFSLENARPCEPKIDSVLDAKGGLTPFAAAMMLDGGKKGDGARGCCQGALWYGLWLSVPLYLDPETNAPDSCSGLMFAGSHGSTRYYSTETCVRVAIWRDPLARMDFMDRAAHHNIPIDNFIRRETEKAARDQDFVIETNRRLASCWEFVLEYILKKDCDLTRESIQKWRETSGASAAQLLEWIGRINLPKDRETQDNVTYICSLLLHLDDDDDAKHALIVGAETVSCRPLHFATWGHLSLDNGNLNGARRFLGLARDKLLQFPERSNPIDGEQIMLLEQRLNEPDVEQKAALWKKQALRRNMAADDARAAEKMPEEEQDPLVAALWNEKLEAAKKEVHREEAEALVARVWKEEGGQTEAPREATEAFVTALWKQQHEGGEKEATRDAMEALADTLWKSKLEAAEKEATREAARAEEAAHKKAQQKAARKKAQEKATRKKAQEEAARKEASHKKAQEKAARKEAQEEAAWKRAREEEAWERARLAAAWMILRAAWERAEEEAARQKAEEELASLLFWVPAMVAAVIIHAVALAMGKANYTPWLLTL